jgi:hypothetical protein
MHISRNPTKNIGARTIESPPSNAALPSRPLPNDSTLQTNKATVKTRLASPRSASPGANHSSSKQEQAIAKRANPKRPVGNRSHLLRNPTGSAACTGLLFQLPDHSHLKLPRIRRTYSHQLARLQEAESAPRSCDVGESRSATESRTRLWSAGFGGAGFWNGGGKGLAFAGWWCVPVVPH